MSSSVQLGPLTTKRLNEVEELVEITKKKEQKFYWEVKGHRDLIKVFFMSQRV